MRAVFLDRDGTIIEDPYKNGSFDKVEFLPGTIEAIRKLNEKFLVIVVTNQPAVAKELQTEDQIQKSNKKMVDLLKSEGARIDAVYYCPHHPETLYTQNKYRTECNCRKPKTGMLEEAAKAFGLDLNQCWMIGDTTRDIETGKRAGCKTILVRTGEAGQDGKFVVSPNYTANDLLEASDILLKNTNDKQTPTNDAKRPSTQASITQAVILAGGRGERLKPLTDTLPKPMLPVAGKPLLEWQLLLLKNHGITNIIICASYISDKIKDYFGSDWNGMKILYPEESQPMGTGGAIKNCSEWLAAKGGGSSLDENFLVINGDVANLVDFSSIIDFHFSKGALATLVVRHSDHPKDSDILDVNENGRVIGFVGRGQDTKTLANTGLFVLNKEIVKKIPDGFCTLEKDVIVKHLDENVFAYISDEYIKDMGTLERYEKVKQDFPVKMTEAGLFK